MTGLQRAIFPALATVLALFNLIFLPDLAFPSEGALVYWRIAGDVLEIILLSVWASYAQRWHLLLLVLGLFILPDALHFLILIIPGHLPGLRVLNPSESAILLATDIAFLTVIVTVLILIQRLNQLRQRVVYQRRLLQSTIDALPISLGVHLRDGSTVVDNLQQAHRHKPATIPSLLNEQLMQQIWHKLDSSAQHSEVRGKLFNYQRTLVKNEAFIEVGYTLLDLPCLRNDTTQDHLMVYGIDVSQREALLRSVMQTKDEAEHANRAKSRFLANVSHELRTPLTSIVGFSQLIEMREDVDDELRDMIETISQNSESLLMLVNDVLDLSKAEAGKLTFNSSLFSPRGLLTEEINTFRPRCQAKALLLQVNVTPDVPDRIDGDAGKLRQILRNLLSNAVKFTDTGFLRVRMWSSDLPRLHEQLPTPPAGFSSATLSKLAQQARDHLPSNATHITLHIEVCDSGQGIAYDELTTIFEPFTQSRSGAMSQQGTGLGLAICKKLTLFLGGDLVINSKVGKGTCCHFWIEAHREP